MKLCRRKLPLVNSTLDAVQVRDKLPILVVSYATFVLEQSGLQRSNVNVATMEPRKESGEHARFARRAEHFHFASCCRLGFKGNLCEAIIIGRSTALRHTVWDTVKCFCPIDIRAFLRISPFLLSRNLRFSSCI